MAGEFDSAWLKWAWAVRDAHFFQEDIASFRPQTQGGRVYTTRTEYEPKRHCVVLRVATLAPMPETWSLQLGDIVHGYRSCLDHIAWAMYKRGKTPNVGGKRERRIGFPAKSSARELRGALPYLIPGICRADEAIVRSRQPYRVARTKRRFHVVTLLFPMANFDKHRSIQPLFAVPGEAYSTQVANPRDCLITRIPTTARRLPLQEGAELHRVYVRKTGPNPRVDMDIDVSPLVVLNKEITVHEWLTQIRSFTYHLLAALQFPPIARLGNIGVRVGSKRGVPAVDVVH